jgi:shikimate kinase
MKNKRCIYLIGFMASGKSTVGRRLAEKLGLLFRDIDEIIESKEGIPIWKIFETKGESYFREMEKRLMRELTQSTKDRGTVIATGGGLPCNQDNLQFMKDHGLVVYLKLGVNDIILRIGSSRSRPVFHQLRQSGTLRESVETLLTSRENYYNQADLTVMNNNDTDIESVVEGIIKNIKLMK